MAEHVLSERGFKHHEPVETDRATVRVYESSDASSPHLWLSLLGEGFLGEEPRPVAGVSHGVAITTVAAHMTLEQATAVRDTLDAAIAAHYQGAPTDG